MLDEQAEALEDAIAAAGDKIKPEHSAIVALCRLLAGQMDRAVADSEDGPSSRLSAAYLSALINLNRVIAAGEKGAARAPGKLAQLRAIQGGAGSPGGRRTSARRKAGA